MEINQIVSVELYKEEFNYNSLESRSGTQEYFFRAFSSSSEGRSHSESTLEALANDLRRYIIKTVKSRQVVWANLTKRESWCTLDDKERCTMYGFRIPLSDDEFDLFNQLMVKN